MPLGIDLDLGAICTPLNTGPGELCVTFIGGATLCAQTGYELGDPTTIVTSLLSQLNSALAPLQPFFTILDFVKAVFDCIKAIPDCLGPPPSPQPILSCISGLTEVVNKLLQLIPPFPILRMVKGILNVIIVGLEGLKSRLQAIIDQTTRVLNAATKAAQTGNVSLLGIVDCAQGNLDVQKANLNASLAPLNRLIGVVNLLLELAGEDCIPAIGEVDALGPLQDVIDFLTAIYNAIPDAPQLAEIQGGQCL
jgi:hypothetical protein